MKNIKPLFEDRNTSTIPKGIYNRLCFLDTQISININGVKKTRLSLVRLAHFQDLNFYLIKDWFTFFKININKGLYNEKGIKITLEYKSYEYLFEEFSKGFKKGYYDFEGQLHPKSELFTPTNEQTAFKIYSYVDEKFTQSTFSSKIVFKGDKTISSITPETMYKDGLKWGKQYKAWEIILDNIPLFEPLFKKYEESHSKIETLNKRQKDFKGWHSEYELRQFVDMATRWGLDGVYRDRTEQKPYTVFTEYTNSARENFELFSIQLNKKLTENENWKAIGIELNQKFLLSINQYIEWYNENIAELEKFQPHCPYTLMLSIIESTKDQILQYFPDLIQAKTEEKINKKDFKTIPKLKAWLIVATKDIKLLHSNGNSYNFIEEKFFGEDLDFTKGKYRAYISDSMGVNLKSPKNLYATNNNSIVSDIFEHCTKQGIKMNEEFISYYNRIDSIN